MSPALLIPLIAVGAPFLVAIIAMMTKHQREMAELMQRNSVAQDPRVDAIQRDLAELKTLVHQQTIALDGLRALPAEPRVQERIGG